MEIPVLQHSIAPKLDGPMALVVDVPVELTYAHDTAKGGEHYGW